MIDLAVMIDLETLATTQDSVIVSIGAVGFSLNSINTPDELVERGFHVRVELDDQPGRRIDPATVKWWMDQSNAARKEVTSHGRKSFHEALLALSDYVHAFEYPDDFGTLTAWSHGSDFDLPILLHAYKSLGMSTPWRHQRARDTRTLKWMVEQFYGLEQADAAIVEGQNKHNPLWDAACQAVTVQTHHGMLVRLAGGRG